MKQGRTMGALTSEVMRQFESKQDMIVPSSMMAMNEEANLIAGGEVYPIREHAHQQIASKLGIPYGYYNKMLTQETALLQQNVNTWIGRSEDRRMVRVLDGHVRAVLSDRYMRLDNYDLLEAVLPIFMSDPEFKVASCEVTETKLFLKVTNSRIKGEVRVGDVVESGIMITNSEVGAGTLTIDPMIHRLVCLNGAVINKVGIRRVHLGRQAGETDDILRMYSEATRNLDAQAFFSKVKDLVSNTFDSVKFGEMVAMMRVASTDEIKIKPTEIIEKLENKKMFQPEDGQGILEKLLYSRDLTRYGLSNAITSHSQDVESYAKATELEELGGDIITMPATDWRVLNS